MSTDRFLLMWLDPYGWLDIAMLNSNQNVNLQIDEFTDHVNVGWTKFGEHPGYLMVSLKNNFFF